VNSRIGGASLFGLGVFFIVVAVGLPLYVAPRAAKLPYDLKETTTVAQAENATFLHISPAGLIIETGPLTGITVVKPQAKKTEELPDNLKGKAAVWDVFQYARNSQGENVSLSLDEIAVDRVTNAAVDWDGAYSATSDGGQAKTAFSGQLYKFPFGTKKKTYQVWDGDLGQAFPAEFQAVDKVNGVEVYRFEQVVPRSEQVVDSGSMAALLSAFAPNATTGKVYYNNTRTLWVEPVTGQYLNVREQQHKELVADDGTTKLLLDADFNYTADTVKDSVDTAKSNKGQLQLLTLWGPIVLGLLGLILAIVGLVMVIRRRGDHVPAHSADSDEDTLVNA
jgi:hypothetical protein